MGRYQAKKRGEKEEKKTTPRQRTFTTGRRKPGGKNRTAVKTEPKKLANIPPSKRPKDMQAGKVYGDAGQPKAPKLPPKPTAAKPKPTPPKKPAATSSKKLTPMQQWAKAHPELAKKVKKGQAGAKELKIGRSTKKRTWLDKNYKPGKK